MSSQALEISENIPFLSVLMMQISALYDFPTFRSSHSTSINLAFSSSGRDVMLEQSFLWTEMPLPFVIKPIISSPGTGLQHLETLIIRLSAPFTMMPGFSLLERSSLSFLASFESRAFCFSSSFFCSILFSSAK